MIWCACQEFDITPPDLPDRPGKLSWDDLANVHQAALIAFLQTKQHEEAKQQADVMKAMVPRAPAMGKGKGRKGRK